LPVTKGAKGWGAEIAPLTPAGICQIRNIVPEVREWSPQLIVTSPTSRTLHSCALLSLGLTLPFEVEFDLHEWYPHKNLNWASMAEVEASLEEMERLGGEWPEGRTCVWEPLSAVRQRVLNVLERYRQYIRVAVTCHQIVIKSLTGETLDLAEYTEFRL